MADDGSRVAAAVVFWDGDTGHPPDVALVDRDPAALEARLAGALYEAMAEAGAHPVWAPFLERHGGPGTDPGSVSEWLAAVRREARGAPWFYQDTARLAGAGADGGAVRVAAMVGEDVWEERIFASTDPAALVSMVADIAWERLVREGTAPADRAGLPDRVLAEGAARFATATLPPAGSAPVAARAPGAGSDGAGLTEVTVGAFFAGPSGRAAPVLFASRDRAVVERAVADAVRDDAIRRGSVSADAPPVGTAPSWWLELADRWDSPVWHAVVDVEARGLGGNDEMIEVAVLVDGRHEAYAVAAADAGVVREVVAGMLYNRLAVYPMRGEAWTFLAEHGAPRLGEPDRLPGWIEAHQAAFDLPEITFETVPLITADEAAGPGAGPGGRLTAGPAAAPGPAADGGMVSVGMPAVWADLDGSGIAEMVSEMFRPAPRRDDYPPGAVGDRAFEGEREAWREECLELASAAAHLPAVLDRLDLLEHQRGVLAAQVAREPLPAEPVRDDHGSGAAGAVAHQWESRTWADRFAATARRRDALVRRLLDASRPDPAASGGFRDTAEDQARALVAALARLIQPADGPDGRSLAERGLDRSGRLEVAGLVAGDIDVEVHGVGDPEFRYRGAAGQAHRRLGAGWYEATTPGGRDPVGLVVGRDPYGDGSMVSGAHRLDAATAARLAPVRRLTEQAAEIASARPVAATGPAGRAGLAPASAFGRADQPRPGAGHTI